MARNCIVTNCGASNRDFGTVLFSIPKADDLRRRWAKALGKPESWTVPDTAFVCWSHFKNRDILQDESSFRRSTDAVPSQYLSDNLFDPDYDYFCRFCARKLFSELMGTNISDMNRSEDAKKFLNLLLPDGNDRDLSNLACDECMMHIKLTMRFIRNCAKATRELEDIVRMRGSKSADYETNCGVKIEMDNSEETSEENIQSDIKVEVANLEEISDQNYLSSDTEDDIPLAVQFQQTSSNSELKCSYCSFSCSRRIQLASHMKKHRDILPHRKYSCSYCEFQCAKPDQLTSHLRKHKKKQQQFSQEESLNDDQIEDVDNMGEQPDKTLQLGTYSEEHNSKPEKLQCSECPYTCTRVIQLASHKKKHFGYKHKKAQRDQKKKVKDNYECEFCDFKCKQSRQMAGHRAFHSDLIRKSKPSGKERDHMCSICGKILSTRGSFFVHMKYHNDQRDYPCSMCDKKFYSKRDVTMHIESLHQKKIFECEICGVKCTWKNALNKHMRKHNSESYKHECSYCGKKFMAANELRLHVWRHTGQQLSCDLCGAGYRFNFLLTQHKIRVHGIQIDGVKLYKRFRKDRPVSSKRNTSGTDTTVLDTNFDTTANDMPPIELPHVPLVEHRPPVEETSSSSYSSDMPTNYPHHILQASAVGPHLPIPLHPLGASLVGQHITHGPTQSNTFSNY